MAKYYRCLVVGDIPEKQLQKGYLLKDERENAVSIFQNGEPNRKYIETEYEPVERFGDYTLLEVHLITGRSHQIRAHLASLGHPLVGDPKYGDEKQNRIFERKAGINRQLLHAYRIRFSDGNEICAELPPDFQGALDYLRERNAHK
jgi:23S rRNA pseudouridine955/2504/2580 synthase